MTPTLDLLTGKTGIVPFNAVFGQPTVLVIDDSEDCCQIAAHVVTQLGGHCLTAATGTDGFAMAISSTPNLILLDVILPDFSGFELLKKINRHHHTAHTIVIAVTALASPDDQERLLSAGCMSCLSKPYILQDLSALLRLYLNGDCQQFGYLDPLQSGSSAPEAS